MMTLTMILVLTFGPLVPYQGSGGGKAKSSGGAMQKQPLRKP